MVEYMEMMTVTEAEGLKRTIKELFRQTCIIQMKYDPVTLVPRDNPNYRICQKHQKFIEDYLSVIGCDLRYDPQESIYRIEGEGVVTEKMSEITTLLVLILKMIYKDKIMGEGLHATVTSLSEIREYGKNTNLINRRLTSAEWREALSLMSRHQMIELPGAIAHVEDDTPIYIYSTVNIYCASVDINAVVEKYREEVMKIVAKESADETGEEDIYEDPAE
ncbi:MAG: DUF4194 domain-containing protein [Clostridia bacterium]|nr:DUF4194 domain-containing protein [Clostridia bacterium]NCC42548.1 DUF4194 domain-containing protein [Clostridia bacterium]